MKSAIRRKLTSFPTLSLNNTLLISFEQIRYLVHLGKGLTWNPYTTLKRQQKARRFRLTNPLNFQFDTKKIIFSSSSAPQHHQNPPVSYPYNPKSLCFQ